MPRLRSAICATLMSAGFAYHVLGTAADVLFVIFICLAAGIFDPLGFSKGNLEELKLKEIKNGALLQPLHRDVKASLICQGIRMEEARLT